MTALIVNPEPLGPVHAVVENITNWLTEDAIQGAPHAPDEVFDEKWEALSGRKVREVLSCLVREGGVSVKEANLKRCLRSQFGVEKNESGAQVREARAHFISTDLVKCDLNIVSGDEYSLNPAWEWHLKRALGAWESNRGR